MRGLSRVVLSTAVVLFSSGVTSSMAGKSLSVSPALLSQPIVSVKPGQAKSYQYQAITGAPVKKTGLVRAAGMAWQCQGKRCTITGPWPNPAVNACRALARQVGLIRSYGSKARKLSSAQMKQCNAGVAAKSAPPIRNLVSPTPKLAARSTQALASPAVPHTLKTVPVVKPKRGFTAANASASVAVKKSGKPMGGFALKKRQLNGGLSAPNKQPLERKRGATLFAPLTKKESRVDRKTGRVQNNKQDRSDGARVKPSGRGGFAPTSPRAAGGMAATPGRGGGGFAPAGIAGQVAGHNALSAQQIASINIRKGYWQDYQRAMEAQRRRDAARVRERMERLSREAYLSGADCDDSDRDIHPGLLEVCDHKDNNCDGRVDEGATILAYADLDGDGHGDPPTAMEVCPSDITAARRKEEWLATVGNDCDDSDPDRWRDCAASGTGR